MRKILFSLLLLAVAGLGWFWLRHSRAESAEAAPAPTAKVETAVLKEIGMSQTLEAFGVIGSAPSGEITLTAPYEGSVRAIRVSVGTAVKAGDVLLELDPTADEKSAFASARSAQAYAAQALEAAQQRYDLKLATRPELLAAQQALDDARSKLAALDARGTAGSPNVVARADGVVSKLDLAAGSRVALGTPLVSISTGTQLEARLGVEAADLKSVAADQPVTLESVNRADADKVAARVRAVGAALDPVTGAAEVRVALPADAPLLLGEHVRAAIEIKHKDKALVIPRRAVLPDDEAQVLFTVKAGKAVRHKVALGLIGDVVVEVIAADLQPGDVVVTQGNYELEDGMAVQLPEPERKPAAEGKP